MDKRKEATYRETTKPAVIAEAKEKSPSQVHGMPLFSAAAEKASK